MKARGFTIVELLIVIVVIGILAAITVVAFNGIQTQASNTQTTNAMKDYAKALHSYALDNADYPATSGCLGEDYPAPNNRCLSQNGTGACFGLGAATSLVTTTALKPYMGNKASIPSMQGTECGGTTYVGMYYNYTAANRTATARMVLKGNVATCPTITPHVTSTVRVQTDNTTLCAYNFGSAAAL